jgi:dCMP deaminase
MFVVQEKQSGLYLKCLWKGQIKLQRYHWTKDINEARLFKRSSDAKNSLHSPNFNELYNLISCLITPEQKTFYKVDCSISCTFRPQIFNTRSEAEEFIRSGKTDGHGLHRDYFKVSTTTDKPKQKAYTGRPTWTDYFLGLALVVSKRSHDIHTQHGCIIVDGKTNHILATGYNGFPRGMKDHSLPTNRPDPAKPEQDDKYAWMLHSEFNACCNLTGPIDERTIAYVTGEPCTPCLMCLWQHGVTQVIHRDAYGSKHLIDEKTRKRRDVLLAQTGMRVQAVKADLSWLTAAVSP